MLFVSWDEHWLNNTMIFCISNSVARFSINSAQFGSDIFAFHLLQTYLIFVFFSPLVQFSAQFFSTRKSQQNRFVNKNVTRKNFQILTLFVFLEPNPYLIFVTGTTGISASVKFSNDALILLMY